MTARDLTQNSPNSDGRQEPLDETVGGSVTKSEKVRILHALEGFGWNQSRGIRTVMCAFVESAAVRDAVFEQLRAQHAAA